MSHVKILCLIFFEYSDRNLRNGSKYFLKNAFPLNVKNILLYIVFLFTPVKR